MQGCKPRIRAPRAVLLISELEPTSSHLRVPVCVCTARPHHDGVPQCARLTRCVQLLSFSSYTPRRQRLVSPPPRSHTVDTFPVTAKFPPLVAIQSLRPKTRESPTLVGRRCKHMPPRKAPRSLHVAYVAHDASQVGPRL